MYDEKQDLLCTHGTTRSEHYAKSLFYYYVVQ